MIFVVIGFIWLVLTAPAMVGKTSPQRFGKAAVTSGFGVMFPLFVFFFSAFLVPEWKGACHHGWLDCFHLGKLVLTPLVLWATGALYILDVYDKEPPFSRGLMLGLFTGATVAGGCVLYGLLIADQLGSAALWLLVPLYVSVWHAGRFVQLRKYSTVGKKSLGFTLLGSLPFWLGGALWSMDIFRTLPDQMPAGCFVVTAASRGHRNFVGPFVEIRRRGELRSVNQQLVAFWRLEELWSALAPRSHAGFRKIYNFLGPIIAHSIRSPWIADAAYVALKPAECLARLILSCAAALRFLSQPQPGVTP